jgi:hypothetical protein
MFGLLNSGPLDRSGAVVMIAKDELDTEQLPDAPSNLPCDTDGLNELLVRTRGDRRVCIAVLDGNLDAHHPALAAEGLATLEGPASNGVEGQGADSAEGQAGRHALQVASILFGRADGPVRGLTTECSGLLIPIFRDGPAGEPLPCSQLDLSRAISMATERGANIINISGGQFSPTDSSYSLLARSVRQAAERGVLLVAAAGNDGCECLHVPAALPGVLAVGSLDQSGRPLESSNWGDAYRTQGILAPGEAIRVASSPNEALRVSGTSFSTAVVSGIAGLLMSLELQSGRLPDGQRIRQILLESCDGCDEDSPECRRLLAGKLNLRRALHMLIDRSVPMNPLSNDSTSLPETTSPALTGVTASTGAQAQQPGSCGCGGGIAAPAQKVFALGRLGVDFGTIARRDSIRIHMESTTDVSNGQQQPDNLTHLLSFLAEKPYEAESLIWTLHLDDTPVYAIAPAGPFAGLVYERMRQFLNSQLQGNIGVVSLPGVLEGQVRLMSGQILPVVRPVLRGMYSWDVQELVKQVLRETLDGKKPTKDDKSQLESSVKNFLHRVYFELRNLGTSAPDRALNYAATNALLVADTYESALNDGLELDTIEVEASQVSRPDSECWDIKLYFFNPRLETVAVRRVFRFTVDVSDVVPVMVGQVRSWSAR